MDDYTSTDSGSERILASDQKGSSGDDRDSGRHFYQIGEVAREFGFTLRALRFYEEKGLVSPVRTGTRRLYSARDRQRLDIIAQCKRIGLALEEIRVILRAADQPNGERRQLETALEMFNERVDLIDAEQERLQESRQEALVLITDLKKRLDRLK